MVIFDVDQTLIDSTIRESLCRLSCGSLDLSEYRRIKHELIKSDSVLPLGIAFKELKERSSFKWRIVTARHIDNMDRLTLSVLLGLDYHDFVNGRVICRNNAGDFGGDGNEQDSGKYKKPIIDRLAYFSPSRLHVIDDCPSVLSLSGHFQTVSAYDFYHSTVSECKSRLLSFV